MLSAWLCAEDVAGGAQPNYPVAYTFSTFAGDAGNGNIDGAGSEARFYGPSAVALDAKGNLYIADRNNHTIRKLNPAGLVSTIAGYPGVYGSADGTNSLARFNNPNSVAIDNQGNLFVADENNHAIRKIVPVGTNWAVSTLAGTPGASGSADGLGSEARFDGPKGVAVDNSGNVLVADTYNNMIRMITSNGSVTTLAGASSGGQPGGNHDGTNTAAEFNFPEGLAVATNGVIYVADSGNLAIRQINRADTNWVVTTLTGVSGQLAHPVGLAVGSDGTLYVCDDERSSIVKITASGPGWKATDLAGSPFKQGQTDGTGTNALFNLPAGLALDGAGNVFVADAGNNAIRRVTLAGAVRTLAGLAQSTGAVDGEGNRARFNQPYGTAVDDFANVYVADTANSIIRQITAGGQVVTLAGSSGNPASTDGIGTDARFNLPEAVAVDAAGNVFVADTGNHNIRLITPAGVVSTVAGNAGSPGTLDGTNTDARFDTPHGLAVDTNGNIYVTDSAIRRISRDGSNWLVATLAGQPGMSGTNDGTGTNALFRVPQGIAVDSATTNIYIADTRNHSIRQLAPIGTNWTSSTLAGLPGTPGTNDGIGTSARFNFPSGLALDASGNLYVVDTRNKTVRKCTRVGADWAVTTIGGLVGVSGSADGAGNAARFSFRDQDSDIKTAGDGGTIAADAAGTLYIADTLNNTIRKGVFTEYVATNLAAYAPSPLTSQFVVVLLPPEAHGQWRFPGEAIWRDSGTGATNLAAGDYPLQFRRVPGYAIVLTNFVVSVEEGQARFVTNQYYPILNAAAESAGSLAVTIEPNAPPGSGWRFVGEGNWRPPGSTATNLLPDLYVIEFSPVRGYSTPANSAAQVGAGAETVVFANYLLAASPPAGILLPAQVPAEQISDLNSSPHGFNGQVLSDGRYGSGFAVEANVVLTAAHLVFNDQTLSYASQVYWFWREEKGLFEVPPMRARAFFLPGGYAAQRTNDLQSGLYAPDQSTPQSRNLDVAALYFLNPVAAGGYGGYLPSDAMPNPWLTGSSQKMLLGYPVNGSLFGDTNIVAGTLYQVGPQPYPLSLALDQVENQAVYLSTWFLSYPGNSGGPLYVEFNGYYYPAAVYLGTLYNGAQPFASVVRAIDSTVTNLIMLAAALADTGTNNTSGGVVRFIPDLTITANNPGILLCDLEPPAAVRAGAAWRAGTNGPYSAVPNSVLQVTSTIPILIDFKLINGWNAPSNRTVPVLPGLNIFAANYTVTNPILLASKSIGLAISGLTGTTYQIETRASLASGSWGVLSTNTITSNGANIVLQNLRTNSGFYRALWLP